MDFLELSLRSDERGYLSNEDNSLELFLYYHTDNRDRGGISF